MFDIQIYTDYVSRIGGTWIGKTVYSVGVGALGVVILAVFFAGFLSASTLDILMPAFVGFNAALTGYMVIDKNRNMTRRRQLLSMAAGTAMVLTAAVGLNIVFYKWVGYLLVGIGGLAIQLAIAIPASALGAKLCSKYLSLNQSG